jgi:hypothetical protein
MERSFANGAVIRGNLRPYTTAAAGTGAERLTRRTCQSIEEANRRAVQIGLLPSAEQT